jgi:hypothetical protein
MFVIEGRKCLIVVKGLEARSRLMTKAVRLPRTRCHPDGTTSLFLLQLLAAAFSRAGYAELQQVVVGSHAEDARHQRRRDRRPKDVT